MMILFQYTRLVHTQNQCASRAALEPPPHSSRGPIFGLPNSTVERALDCDKLNHKQASRYRRVPMVSAPWIYTKRDGKSGS
jgi:hypothetical protein